MMHLQGTPRAQPPRLFTDWLCSVDAVLLRRFGVEARQLDHPWIAEFNVGSSPHEAVDGYADTLGGRRSHITL